MDEQRKRGGTLDDVVVLILLGADLAEHDGIRDLQMRGIGRERKVDGVSLQFAVRRGAKMVLHVAGALDLVRNERTALELVEDGPVGLAQHLREHVQASAMGHAQHDVAHTQLRTGLQNSSRAGIVASAPSRPNRLVPTNFLSRYRS